jgi:protein arginine kinase
MDFSLLPDSGVGWLDASGPDSMIVLSTRVRLARNLAGRPFPGKTSREDRRTILESVLQAGRNSNQLARAVSVELGLLSRLERQILYERHLVSKELAGLANRPVSSAGLLSDGALGVMINEEDHLRLQVLKSGFDLSAASGSIQRLDNDLGQTLSFAFHPQFGYLTSCPTNVGTGLRASVLIHLPGLVLTKEISKVLQGLGQVGLTFRGLYGEGSEVVGNFFQLSNQTTLGKSEDELVDQLGKVVRQVVEYELEAREVLDRDAPVVLADKVWRAYGLLSYARSLSFEETMNLLSGVRLGVGLGTIQNVNTYTLNKLLVYTQAGHLEDVIGVDVSEADLNEARAEYVRSLLKSGQGGGAGKPE